MIPAPPLVQDCPICLEPVEPTHAWARLECTHVFHSACVLQSAMHDPRCPVCRTELAKRPEVQQAHVVNVELTLHDMQVAVDEEVRSVRRQQVNYDARRRRFLRGQPQLRAQFDVVQEQRRQLRSLERRLEDAWSRESRALWMGPAFVAQKRERALLLRRIRRGERMVDAAVAEVLGARPEVRDSDDESHVLRALANIGRERVAQIATRAQDDTPEVPRGDADGDASESDA